MTARQLQPTVVDMNQLMRNGDYVGYRGGSFVKDLLISLKVDEHKIRNYSSPDQFAEALMRGSGNGGVAAIFDEIPSSFLCPNIAVTTVLLVVYTKPVDLAL
jgi:ionotropic glutamate receptor